MEAFSGSLRGLGQLMGFAVNPSPFIYCCTRCADRLDAAGSSLTSACYLGLLSRLFSNKGLHWMTGESCIAVPHVPLFSQLEVDKGGWWCHFVVDITGVFSDGLERMWGAAFLGIVLPEILPKPTIEDGVLLWGEVCLNSFFSGALLSVLKLGGNVLWLWLWLMLNSGRFS
ncbi:hypothetical protein Ancab_012327 [Ancistrocladus abbreviatus]